MKIKKILQWGVSRLRNSPSSRLDAEVLLAFALKTDRTCLYQNPDQEVKPARLKNYRRLIRQRATFVPVAYLVHQKEFLGLPFYVNQSVLIPRPETEALVERAIRLAEDKNIKKIHDVGTGSGNIAVSLAVNLPKARIVASDICQQALKVAARNAREHQVASRIQFIRSDLAQHIRSAKLIIANLPYVPLRFLVPPDIIYEPRRSLFAGEDGLTLYKRFFTGSIFQHFKGICIIELGPRQVSAMKKWLRRCFSNITIAPLRGIDGQVVGLEIEFN